MNRVFFFARLGALRNVWNALARSSAFAATAGFLAPRSEFGAQYLKINRINPNVTAL
ncbi:MAG: hypothetical protein AB7D27_13560 [Desulfomicrobium sp.]